LSFSVLLIEIREYCNKKARVAPKKEDEIIRTNNCFFDKCILLQ